MVSRINRVCVLNYSLQIIDQDLYSIDTGLIHAVS